MFYRPEDGHGLPHNPFNALVAPRPIGWVATRGQMGDNLAPYSFFMAVAYDPPQVIFASTSAKPDRAGGKDSLAQIVESGVFAVSLPRIDHLAAMNATSAPAAAGVDEFALARVPKAECTSINCPRVADAITTLECRLVQVVALPGEANSLIIGQVTGVHIADDCLKDGLVRLPDGGLIARMGYRDYAAITETFTLARPAD
ncbi:flavin reductase family protein [Paracoccus sp. p4-l81]|uniref:flavin reductase family protein n=1 Tax=unclassified Paracoccus (in: a-proteobacteria) TaxID=2688777 RepID=UPI0035BAF984